MCVRKINKKQYALMDDNNIPVHTLPTHVRVRLQNCKNINF